AVTHLSGPAYDEVHSGIPRNRNTAAKGDFDEARRILREEGGLTGEDLNKAIDNLYERAKKHVSHPGAANIAKVNAALREAGLPENLHMSPARMENLVKLLKGALNGTTEAPTDGGVRTGSADEGVQSGEPTDTRAGGEEQNGPAKGAQSEEVRETGGKSEKSNLANPREGIKERSTGDEKVDAAIRAGGAIPAGRMGPLSMFHHESGSTLALPHDEVTPEAVKEHLAQTTEKYNQA